MAEGGVGAIAANLAGHTLGEVWAKELLVTYVEGYVVVARPQTRKKDMKNSF
jgi:hypothetical protein